jgi:lipopolysaccharide heptosyltransferase I
MAGKPPGRPRILIIKPSSLGDIIHALPTVNLIRRQYSEAHIAWLVNTAFVSLLRQCPVIDEVLPFHRQLYGSPLTLPAFAKFLAALRRQQFDIVVDLQGLLRSGFIARVTGAPRCIGLSDSREGASWFHNEVVPVSRLHAVDRYLLAARHLGCPAGPIEFPLGLGAGLQREGLIAINASARWATKLWGDDRFAELIRQLPRERVVLTGSAADAERLGKIAQGCRNVAGQTDLFELAALYRQCAVVISNDSGPMHLAAAVGTPVVAIFGPTDPALTGPYGETKTVLQARIPCVPCFKDYCTNPVKMECMAKVTVADVLAAVRRFL